MDDVELMAALSDPARRAEEFTHTVRAYYERVTDSYRATWGESFHFGLFEQGESRAEAIGLTELRLAEHAGLSVGMRVLDIGCGVGGPALTIAQATGAHVTGIDIVPHHVDIARRRAQRTGLERQVDFVVGDGQRLPFAEGSFDAVYVLEAGCYMPDTRRYVSECARVLRRGGVFTGIDWARGPDVDPAGEHLLEAVCRAHAIPRLFDSRELRTHLESAGFVVDRVDDVSSAGDQVLRNHAELRVVGGVGLHASLQGVAGRLLVDGGLALSEAAARGHFILVGWQAART